MNHQAPVTGHVELYWLPLGAGDNTRCVRTNGRLYEALTARYQRRSTCDLYHAALEIHLAGERFVIEMTPTWSSSEERERGVVREGPVGMRWLGRSRFFRYEVRCWRQGVIPDVAYAVESPQRLSTNPTQAAQILAAAPHFPPATWGRDELDTGDMWNSNSLVAWLLARSGHDMDAVHPPAKGRAPGWRAGLVVAARPDDRY